MKALHMNMNGVGSPGAPMVLMTFLALFLTLPALGDVGQADLVKNPLQYSVEDIQGAAVQVREKGSGDWEQAEEGQTLQAGDEIRAGDGCEATLMLMDETSVRLSAGGDLTVGRLEPGGQGGFFSRLVLAAGTLLSDVKKGLQKDGSEFEVEAGGVVCGVRGTAFEVDTRDGEVQTSVHEGSVEVAGQEGTRLIPAGHLSAFHAGKFHLDRRLSRLEHQRFKKWRALRNIVRRKRLKRIEEIKEHKREPWVRKHSAGGKEPRKKFPGLKKKHRATL